ncbi:MAG: phosphohydrolase [Chloroflexota bacterium]
MQRHCPEGRGLRVKLYRCPECRAETLVFSDQGEAWCSACGGELDLEMPPCIEWCANAKDCVAAGYRRMGSGRSQDNARGE